jgi:predicted ABC-type ATPase
LLLVIAGHNGAGKSTCYREYLRDVMAPFIQEHIDPDAIEREIRAEWTEAPLSDDDFSLLASKEAERLRRLYLNSATAFSMETVFSDPVGDKLGFLQEAIRRGYFVVLLAVGLDSPEKSKLRVALRVSRGGHNVKPERSEARYPRVLKNLSRAVELVSLALVVDNSQDNLEDGCGAYFAFAHFANGECIEMESDIPPWWRAAFPPID